LARATQHVSVSGRLEGARLRMGGVQATEESSDQKL
jgi:hypothetical protein